MSILNRLVWPVFMATAFVVSPLVPVIAIAVTPMVAMALVSLDSPRHDVAGRHSYACAVAAAMGTCLMFWAVQGQGVAASASVSWDVLGAVAACTGLASVSYGPVVLGQAVSVLSHAERVAATTATAAVYLIANAGAAVAVFGVAMTMTTWKMPAAAGVGLAFWLGASNAAGNIVFAASLTSSREPKVLAILYAGPCIGLAAMWCMHQFGLRVLDGAHMPAMVAGLTAVVGSLTILNVGGSRHRHERLS